MAALLLKDSPPELNEWLKVEARLNRRSLSQQVLVCLEWCMRTYGEAQFRNPFGTPVAIDARPSVSPVFPSGAELARRIAARVPIDNESAKQMKRGVATLRKTKARDFDYACFA